MLIDLGLNTDIPAYEIKAVIAGTGRINKKMADKLFLAGNEITLALVPNKIYY